MEVYQFWIGSFLSILIGIYDYEFESANYVYISTPKFPICKSKKYELRERVQKVEAEK